MLFISKKSAFPKLRPRNLVNKKDKNTGADISRLCRCVSQACLDGVGQLSHYIYTKIVDGHVTLMHDGHVTSLRVRIRTFYLHVYIHESIGNQLYEC